MGLLSRIFNVQRRILKKLRARAVKIDALKDIMRAKTDDELKAMTAKFRQQIKEAGEENEAKVLDEILEEAFAVCREAAYRVLHQFPFFTYHIDYIQAAGYIRGQIIPRTHGIGVGYTEVVLIQAILHTSVNGRIKRIRAITFYPNIIIGVIAEIPVFTDAMDTQYRSVKIRHSQNKPFLCRLGICLIAIRHRRNIRCIRCTRGHRRIIAGRKGQHKQQNRKEHRQNTLDSHNFTPSK